MKRADPARGLCKLTKENISFVVVILATFLALALIVAMTFGSFYKNARANAVTIGKITVSHEAERIDDSLSSGINTLLVSSYTVDSMMLNGAGPKYIEDYLVKETRGIISGIDPDFSGIYGVISGEYVDGIGWQPEKGYDPYSRPWYTAALEKGGELAIVSPYVDAQTNSIMVSFSKLLHDRKSVISLDVRMDNVYNVTEEIQLNGSGYCFVADSMGQIVAHRDDNEIGKNYLSDIEFQDSDLRSLMEQISASSGEEEVLEMSLNDRRCMIFTGKVMDEWNVVLVVDEADLFKDIRKSLVRNIAISMAIFILVGYFCTSNYKNRKRALRYAEDIRTDDLTGLNNRGEFDRYLRVCVSSTDAVSKLYLLIFDADNFKSINDRFGHQEGDRALRFIADTLAAECKDTDRFCARYGGDEFVVICQCDSYNEVYKLVSEIDTALKLTVKNNRLPYMLSLSCGFACYDKSTQSVSELIDKADRGLYNSKATKPRTRYSGIYSPSAETSRE